MKLSIRERDRQTDRQTEAEKLGEGKKTDSEKKRLGEREKERVTQGDGD